MFIFYIINKLYIYTYCTLNLLYYTLCSKSEDTVRKRSEAQEMSNRAIDRYYYYYD